jgi:quinol-cytochrome oxidoreductase complex cytochrome b subunit
MLIVAAIFPLGQALRPRRLLWHAGFAVTFLLLAVLLFADRDAAPIFGRYGIGGP